jgi:hypothetical protein
MSNVVYKSMVKNNFSFRKKVIRKMLQLRLVIFDKDLSSYKSDLKILD